MMFKMVRALFFKHLITLEAGFILSADKRIRALLNIGRPFPLCSDCRLTSGEEDREDARSPLPLLADLHEQTLALELHSLSNTSTHQYSYNVIIEPGNYSRRTQIHNNATTPVLIIKTGNLTDSSVDRMPTQVLLISTIKLLPTGFSTRKYALRYKRGRVFPQRNML